MEIKLGRFTDISNYEYHNLMPYAYSNSDIKEFGITPANLIQKRNGPQQIDKDSLRIGKALHSRLEFHENENEYLKLVAAAPSVDKRTVAGKKEYEKFELESVNKTILKQDEWDMLEGMLEGLKSHPDARQLLNAKGYYENTFVWVDDDSGVICKCRPDKYIYESPAGMPKDGIIMDWKTIAQCDDYEIMKAAAKYDYHIQAAFYIDGVSKVLGKSSNEFVNCFIGKSGAYRVILGLIDDTCIQIGREIYKERLMRLAECQKHGIYTGFKNISLPDWKIVGK